MKYVAFIFARGGSKGVARKNLQEIGGVSLVGRAVRQALAADKISKVIISTDDQEIADEAVRFGAECPFIRPANLAGDTSKEWDAWKYTVRNLREIGEEFDVFVSVPATSPLRKPADIDRAIELYDQGDVEVVVTGKEADRSPYFNMVQKDAEGNVSLVCDSNISRRQDVPVVYDMTTVAYVMNADYIVNNESIWSQKTKISVVSSDQAVDIDTMSDLVCARALYAENPNYYDDYL
jgi:CMP-N-acetylneuraminic acid synthetase